MNDFTRVLRTRLAAEQPFAGAPGMRAWWRLILALHGKPPIGTADPVADRRVVADGLRFYARLYRLLAMFVAVSSGLFALAGSGAAAVATALGSCALFALIRLADNGARAWLLDPSLARVDLAVFFAGISMLLTAFVAAVAAAVIVDGSLPWLAIVVAAGVVLAVGVGSYAVELVYVVAGSLPQEVQR